MSDRIEVEIVYALPGEQKLYKLSVLPETTVEQAIQASGILEQYPAINLAINKLGIYGKLTRNDATLHDKDRVEIYRPLLADPKEVRRKRAEQGKEMKKGTAA